MGDMLDPIAILRARHASSCALDQAADIREIRIANAEDRRIRPRRTFDGAEVDQTVYFGPLGRMRLNYCEIETRH